MWACDQIASRLMQKISNGKGLVGRLFMQIKMQLAMLDV